MNEKEKIRERRKEIMRVSENVRENFQRKRHLKIVHNEK